MWGEKKMELWGTQEEKDGLMKWREKKQLDRQKEDQESMVSLKWKKCRRRGRKQSKKGAKSSGRIKIGQRPFNKQFYRNQPASSSRGRTLNPQYLEYSRHLLNACWYDFTSWLGQKYLINPSLGRDPCNTYIVNLVFLTCGTTTTWDLIKIGQSCMKIMLF